jgi:hypothetical protein
MAISISTRICLPKTSSLALIPPPFFVQPSRQTRRLIYRSNYLKEDMPKTEYLRNSYMWRC